MTKLVQFSSVAQSCPTLCDPMNHSTPGLPVHHQLPEFTQTHIHQVSDAIQPSHPMSSPSPSAPNPSQHQSLFQWVNSLHEVAKVLDNILKIRDVTLPRKVCLVKAMVFPVVMYRCESWTVKKAECRRIDAFELWCWRRLLRVPWTARRSNQSMLKEISPGCSLETLMLKLKLQYFAHLMQRADFLKRPWCWERLKAGGEGDDRGWDGWMASLTQWTWVWVNSGSWWWTGRPGVLWFTGSQRVRHDWETEVNWN